jgi:hypothetical protein
MAEEETLFGIVTRFFEEEEWVFDRVQGTDIITAGFRGENGSWRCYAQVDEEQEWFVFYSTLDSNIPEARRPAVAEFLTRANYGLVVGNFEMDFQDGETRFKTSINVEKDHLTVGLIEPLVYINLLMMDRYLPGIMRVAYGDKDPAEEVAAIET